MSFLAQPKSPAQRPDNRICDPHQAGHESITLMVVSRSEHLNTPPAEESADHATTAFLLLRGRSPLSTPKFWIIPMEAELARVEVRVSHRSTTSTRTRTPGSGRPARGRTRRAARRSKPAAAVRLRRPRLPPPTLRVRQCPGDRLLLTEGDRRAPAATQPRRSHRHAVVPCRPGVEIPAVSEDVQVRERGGHRYPVRRHRSPRRHVPSMRK